MAQSARRDVASVWVGGKQSIFGQKNPSPLPPRHGPSPTNVKLSCGSRVTGDLIFGAVLAQIRLDKAGACC